MTLSDAIAVAALLVNGALLGFAVRQLALARRIALSHHDRRKKQATFEFVNAVSDRYRAALETLDRKHGRGTVVDVAVMDDEDRASVRGYLNEMERICAGVNTDVFDLDILERMMGSVLIAAHDRFAPHIAAVRVRTGRPRVYAEFEKTVLDLRTRQSAYVPLRTASDVAK